MRTPYECPACRADRIEKNRNLSIGDDPNEAQSQSRRTVQTKDGGQLKEPAKSAFERQEVSRAVRVKALRHRMISVELPQASSGLMHAKAVRARTPRNG